jgi:two-component system response regulator HydG
LVARALHRLSNRKNRSLVAVNCAAFSETLLESELFGHTRGAFTDAHADRKGVFVLANGGTLLLDEVGEMPMRMQAKLLRTLEQGMVRPVGSEREIEVNVRLIAATHCNLEQAVKEGRFREDLYYRINVIALNIPPLRARKTDIPLLVSHFLRKHEHCMASGTIGITPAAEAALGQYDWPGNVRELKNVIERGLALSTRNCLALADLPEKILAHNGQSAFISDDPAALLPLKEVEQRYILHVLRSVGGNKSLAARILGIARETLSRLLRSQATHDE